MKGLYVEDCGAPYRESIGHCTVKLRIQLEAVMHYLATLDYCNS